MKDILDLLVAIDKASVLFPMVEETGKNNHQKYAYAKLKDLYKAVRGPLRKQGVRIVHQTFAQEDGEYLRTALVHVATGQFLDDIARIVPDRPGAQGRAAAMTYIKKAALKNLCAIDAGEDDDDGERDTVYAESIARIKSLVSAHKDRESLWSALKVRFKLGGLSDVHPDDVRSILTFIKGYDGVK